MTDARRTHGSSPTPRAQPFYCPYCGDEDFVPFGDAGEYRCESCARHFAVRFLGIARRDAGDA